MQLEHAEHMHPGWGWSVLGRLILMAALLWITASTWQPALRQALLPWITAEVSWLDDTYRIESLQLRRRAGESVLDMKVSQARCLVLGDRAYCPDPRGRAQASTLAAHLDLVGCLIVVGSLIWPVQRRREWAWRLLWLFPVCGLVWALDVPLILWGSIWSLHHDAYVPGQWSPLLHWVEFLQGGGRQALAGVAVWAVVTLSRNSDLFGWGLGAKLRP